MLPFNDHFHLMISNFSGIMNTVGKEFAVMGV